MHKKLENLSQRARFAREQLELTQGDVAAIVGMKQPDISKIERGATKETPAIARLARALRVSPEWLELGEGEYPGTMLTALAHTVPTITWEQLNMSKMGEIPKLFRVQIQDNSMAPRVIAGAWVQFTSTEIARPGDGVLVRDSANILHFRQYRAGRPGCWEAYADNQAYAALDSDRDGLQVVAVLTAVESRWG